MASKKISTEKEAWTLEFPLTKAEFEQLGTKNVRHIYNKPLEPRPIYLVVVGRTVQEKNYRAVIEAGDFVLRIELSDSQMEHLKKGNGFDIGFTERSGNKIAVVLYVQDFVKDRARREAKEAKNGR